MNKVVEVYCTSDINILNILKHFEACMTEYFQILLYLSFKSLLVTVFPFKSKYQVWEAAMLVTSRNSGNQFPRPDLLKMIPRMAPRSTASISKESMFPKKTIIIENQNSSAFFKSV